MTMKQIAPFLLVAALSACGQSETPKQAANVPTVEELAADLARPTMGDVLCNRVAEATNKRFFGDGKVPYTPSETPPKL